MQKQERPADAAAAEAARQARYGSLPAHVRFEDMTEEVDGAPGGAGAGYDPAGSWKYSACLALDMGL
ncbi:hypothetical protein ACGF1Z_01245 [Streptomyces sp. NPDC048018]|uniref:hypothetical protein n=1 Tax=Streptomyces sp. NPDC048018 TaxID=3365499 RepID=UPI003717DCCD